MGLLVELLETTDEGQESAGFLWWPGVGPVQPFPLGSESALWMVLDQPVLDAATGTEVTAETDPDRWMRALCAAYDGSRLRATPATSHAEPPPWVPVD